MAALRAIPRISVALTHSPKRSFRLLCFQGPNRPEIVILTNYKERAVSSPEFCRQPRWTESYRLSHRSAIPETKPLSFARLLPIPNRLQNPLDTSHSIRCGWYWLYPAMLPRRNRTVWHIRIPTIVRLELNLGN